ncbi:MAG TPA: DUF4286 family protein [Dehalococcoidia bacterium]|nr:DUF4286 family protein [Dehalococcoidia bacterium]
MVAKKGTGVMMVFVDVDPEMDADFNAWYNQEHIPDLLRMPGFLNAARYEALKGGPRYLACYELESVEALQSPEYLEIRRNPSEWTKKMSLSVNGRNYVRNVYAQIYPQENDVHLLGRGMAPALQIGRMEVPQDIEARYNEYYDNMRTPGNLKLPGCIAVRRYHAVEGGPKYMTMYEFEHEKVPETVAWHQQGAHDKMREYTGGTYRHAPGSPGVYCRILPPRAF